MPKASLLTATTTQFFEPFGVEWGHNIPLLARSSVSKHTKLQPPLPGHLPLGKPEGDPNTFKLLVPMRAMPFLLDSEADGAARRQAWLQAQVSNLGAKSRVTQRRT